jgi:hypothetical protein
MFQNLRYILEDCPPNKYKPLTHMKNIKEATVLLLDAPIH